ncbi:MAG: hypothetical protein IKQ25_05365 [Lachnospiraceae bacterium]|nr:hypothetical protein [Lachnospiraceae bacterium]
MIDYSKELFEQKEEIERLIRMAKKQKEECAGIPEGMIKVSPSGGKPQYFFRKEGEAKAKYIPAKEKEFVAKLIKREYAIRSLSKLEEMKKCLQSFLDKYHPQALQHQYANLCEGRKVFLSPFELTDGMYVQQWLEEHPGEKNPYPEQGKYETIQGEYVRSKSEKILADTFYKMQVPYRYEAQLNLGLGRNVYPDFTCLNVRKRKTIYWEHLGLLDMDAYANKNHEKLALYEQNGILLGDTLMISFETAECPLNTTVLRKKIEAILK